MASQVPSEVIQSLLCGYVVALSRNAFSGMRVTPQLTQFERCKLARVAWIRFVPAFGL